MDNFNIRMELILLKVLYNNKSISLVTYRKAKSQLLKGKEGKDG